MPTPEIVPLPTPDIDNMVEGLKHLIERIKAGEFVSFLLAAFRPNGEFLSVERGKMTSRLEMIGLLECWKSDIVNATETDKPAGL
jgi:hypothetical protein